ncbi:HNH endonuclease [Solicola sp. PLA-1-18]|uniref:HNH endonuclease signature motif containing protein n=1 Tax=Solicola sp. PLA-1-18 TaxID=3380532 RepID=UPI003B801E89
MFEDVPVQCLVEALDGHEFVASPAAGPVDLQHLDAIEALERLARWVAAKQYELVGALHEHRADQQWNTPEATQSVQTEVAMARQVSRSAAERQVDRAMVLQHLPQVARLLATGAVCDRVVAEVADEARTLDADAIAVLDARIAPVLTGLTPKRAEHAARAMVMQIDPCAAEQQSRRHRTDRFVSTGPGPVGTAWLRIHGPIEHVSAAYDAVHAHAAGRFADGDPRTMGQLMCDTAIERLTGLPDATSPGAVGIEIGVLMDTDSLLGHQDVPAMMAGYGPLPAGLVRHLVDHTSQVWVRRLFTDPLDDTITARDPRRRRFDGPLRHLIATAERHCQRPGCDCRPRDVDHVTEHAAGGDTTIANAQSLCRPDHTVRHYRHWDVTRDPLTGTTTWHTPSGRTYQATRPPALGHGLQRTVRYRSPLERELARLAHPAP